MGSTLNRRRFLTELGRSGAFVAAGSWLSAIGYTQTTKAAARAVVNRARYR